MDPRLTLTLTGMIIVGCGAGDRSNTIPESAAAKVRQEPIPESVPAVAALPLHRVIDDAFLPPDRGRRIHVAVDTLITRDECRSLVARYREQARPGQVAVQLPGQGALCVENFDGRGTVIHEWMWK